MTTWVIQSNLLQYEQTLPIVEALTEEDIPFVDVTVIPFSEEPLVIDSTDTNLIPYGSTKLIRHAQKQGWSGLYFNEDTFNVETWLNNRNDMLNDDCEIMTIERAYSFMNYYSDRTWFIRPVNDLKTFAGVTITGSEFNKWVDDASHGGYTFDEVQKIVIATPKNIQMEWRYFVVDRQIVDGSAYRVNNQLRKIHEEDENVLVEAQRYADKWLPDSACVMDLALVNDNLRVIEFNCINASGFYDHDLNSIVKALTSHTTKYR